MAEQRATRVIVSPDVIGAAQGDSVRVRVTEPSGGGVDENQLLLFPMAEWQQCLVRALRAALATFLAVVLAGWVAQAITGEAVPPLVRLSVSPAVAILLVALVLALVALLIWLLWSFVEFSLHVDERHPGLRA